MHAYLDLGRRADADSAAARFVRGAGDGATYLGAAATYYGRAGDTATARVLLRRIEAQTRTRYVPPSALARARLASGDRDGAIRALEQGVRDRDLYLFHSVSALERDLRGDPRFEAVRRTVFGGRPAPRLASL